MTELRRRVEALEALAQRTALYGAISEVLNSFPGSANLVAGANITLTPGPGTLTIAASGGGGGGAQKSIFCTLFRGIGEIQPGDYATVNSTPATTITGWSITSTVTGSISVDVRASAGYATRPTAGDSIIGNPSYNILLSSASANEVLILPAWVTAALTAGQRLEFYVVSASLVSEVQIQVFLA